MEANQYLELVNSLMETGASEPVALAIVDQVGKDARVSAMTARNSNGFARNGSGYSKSGSGNGNGKSVAGNGNGVAANGNGNGDRRSYGPLRNGDAPATPRQVGFLQRAGAIIPAGLTKQDASHLIDELKQIGAGQVSAVNR